MTDITELVRRCQARDRDALGILYQTYRQPMMNIIGRYVSGRDDVHDILHDGFVVIFGSLPSLKDPEKLEQWMGRIMRNLSLQYLKQMSHHAHVELIQVQDADIAAPESPQPDEELMMEELEVLIDRLPDGYRQVFRLSMLEKLSHKEIGLILGIAPHLSSSQLLRAKVLLRKYITEYRALSGAVSVLIAVSLIWSLWRSWGISRDAGHSPGHSAFIADTDGRAGTKDADMSDVSAERTEYAESSVRASDVVDGQEAEGAAGESATVAEDRAVAQEDSVVIPSDSIPEQPVWREVPDNSYLYMAEEEHRGREKSDMSLILACAGNVGDRDSRDYVSRGPDTDSSLADIHETTKHYMPFSVGLSVNKQLSGRWSVETGLRYTLLRSEVTTWENGLLRSHSFRRMHYIGIPVKINCWIVKFGGFSAYGHLGVAADVPLKTGPTKMEVQWSAGCGVGVQYDLTHSVSLYAEPSLQYYFDTGSEVKTIRQLRPVEFSLPIGVRFSW